MLVLLLLIWVVWYAGYVVGRYKAGGLFRGLRARLRKRRLPAVVTSVRIDQ